MNIPEGYNRVMPYLIIKSAEGFLEFAKNVFGATEKMKVMREDGETVMHAEVFIGESTIMFANSTDDFPVMNSNMFIYVNNVDETHQKALDAGAANIMAPSNRDYGRSSGITDPYGNTWWITEVPK